MEPLLWILSLFRFLGFLDKAAKNLIYSYPPKCSQDSMLLGLSPALQKNKKHRIIFACKGSMGIITLHFLGVVLKQVVALNPSP